MLKRLLIAVVFSMAFGYIESAVVAYLRALFHPNGFTFPMEVFDATPEGKRLVLTEIGREAATLVLIVTAAWLFGSVHQERVAYFLIIFAVWDIFYYVWLKVLLDWPATLMDWDILFLIPVAWASPVLYPILVSLAMFVFAVAILHRCADGPWRLPAWIGLAGRPRCSSSRSRSASAGRTLPSRIMRTTSAGRCSRPAMAWVSLSRQVLAWARVGGRGVSPGRIEPVN